MVGSPTIENSGESSGKHASDTHMSIERQHADSRSATIVTLAKEMRETSMSGDGLPRMRNKNSDRLMPADAVHADRGSVLALCATISDPRAR